MRDGGGMNFDIFEEAAPGVDNHRKRAAEALTFSRGVDRHRAHLRHRSGRAGADRQGDLAGRAVKPGRYVLAASALFVAAFITAVLVLTLLGQPTPLSPP